MSQGLSQLAMERGNLAEIVGVALAPGYTIRTYLPGDEVALAPIYEASQLGMRTPEDVRKVILDDACFRPERLFILTHGDEVVGTSAAWMNQDDPGVGYLHMVGVAPAHQGKGLARALIVRCLQYTRDEGFSVQRLTTDDWRVAAIVTYLKLRYYPLLREAGHAPRWEKLGAALGLPGILEQAVRAYDARESAVQ